MTDALSEAPAYGIARLLAEGRFVVPSHQRDYAWSDDDVKQLFDDVIDAIKKRASFIFWDYWFFFTVEIYIRF